MTMITFEQDRIRFNYRAAGVALHENRVLLHRSEQDAFWTLPGGRVELLEAAGESLKREMREELSVEVKIERLLWVVENFFEYENCRSHEIGFYFLMSLPQNSRLLHETASFEGRERELKLVFEWRECSALNRMRIYPTFLQEALQSLPTGTEHIVHRDGV